jgi:Zn-dependent protease
VDQRAAASGDPAGPGRPAPQRAPGTIRIGQIGGVDVLVRSSWLFVAVLISVMLAPAVDAVQPGLGGWKYVAGAAFAVLLYLSVLLHEASHALMAKRFGLPVRSITLHFLGGVTEIEGEPDTPGREFGVSVVGPLTSVAVGLAVLPLASLAPDRSLLELAAKGLAGANLVVGVLNLVPGLPLDGGRVLRAVVWRVTGSPHQGTIVAGWGGRVAALLVLVYPFARQYVTGASPSITDFVFANAGPPHPGRPARPAARGGGAPRPGGAGRQHRGARLHRDAERDRQRGGRAGHPRGPAALGRRQHGGTPSRAGDHLLRRHLRGAADPGHAALTGLGVPPPGPRRQRLRRAGHRRRRQGVRGRDLTARGPVPGA